MIDNLTTLTITAASVGFIHTLLASYGLNFVKLGKLERYTHAIAGAMILLSGLGILFLGL